MRKLFLYFLFLVKGLLIAQSDLSDSLNSSETSDTLRFELKPIQVVGFLNSKNPIETPFSISSLTSRQLTFGQKGMSLGESMRSVPGLFIMNDENFAQDIRLSIRGFGSRSAFGIRGIKLFVDGFPQTTADGQSQVDNINLSFILSAEIIRGSSSSIYGNASGGVIQLFTEPYPKQRQIKSSISIGDFGYRNIQSSIGDGANAQKYMLKISSKKDKQNQDKDEIIDPTSLEKILLDFGVNGKIKKVSRGPVVTLNEFEPAAGVKVSKIINLSDDIARNTSSESARISTIPGSNTVGIELPNNSRENVYLSEILNNADFKKKEIKLPIALGKNISGKPIVGDLSSMPHLLIAGTTGSGKSVCINTIILSLLYRHTPERCKFILIDPKMLELSTYEGIPHLLAEVVTDMKEAANALRWCVGEMERRYRLMSALGVRNLKGYNAKVEEAIANGTPIKDPLWKNEESMDAEAPDLAKLPAIVVVVDEFADMMMIVGKKVEELIARIAQKARAAGIHLILATQRPSVDVITGLIKANIPTRCAFQVSSKIDSRTILDQQGAETLLGMGDMLYLPPGSPVPTRVHGAFVDDHEVHAVVADWQKRGEPEYIDEILNGEATAEVLLPGEQPEGEDQEFDAFYDEAVAFVTETRRASVSSVQRKFRIGYNRAARLVEQMEMSGVVSAQGHNGNREVLAPPPHKE
mgnify:CR=1 FL=1